MELEIITLREIIQAQTTPCHMCSHICEVFFYTGNMKVEGKC